MKFSLLMSIYIKEEVDYFNRCMHSIWDEQTKKPDEIILVQDGEITEALLATISFWKNKIGNDFIVVALEHNQGLGKALNQGLKACSYELVARMDTDDIALPQRFEEQLDIFIKNGDIDICSSWISEFNEDENKIISYRKVPENHDEIEKFAKRRNPMNHPAVMYKKSMVEKAGGYQHMPWFEDYYLWARMIQQGAKFYNIQKPLVSMRAGYQQLERRGGFNYAMSEIVLQKEFLKLKFINIFEFIRNVSIRFTSRIVPKYVLKKIYSKIRT